MLKELSQRWINGKEIHDEHDEGNGNQIDNSRIKMKRDIRENTRIRVRNKEVHARELTSKECSD